MHRHTTMLCALAVLTACPADDDGDDDGGGATTASADDTTGAPPASSDGSSGAASETGVDGSGGDESSSSGDGTTGEPSDLLDVYDLEGDELFPEGVTWDPVGRAFFVGSLTEGALYRIAADGTQSTFSESPGEMWRTGGIKVDAQARRIWACTGEEPAKDGTRGMQTITVRDLDSAEVVMTFDFADLDPDAGCNDLTLDTEGGAYASDPAIGVVHRATIDGTFDNWAEHPDFESEALGLGLNGLAVTPDQTVLVLAKFVPRTMFRIAIDDPTDITEIELGGEPFAGATPIAGPDGIVFLDDVLWVTFADRMLSITFEDGWAAGTVASHEVPGAGDGLSTATVADGRVYAVKSEVTAFALGSDPELPFQILRVP